MNQVTNFDVLIVYSETTANSANSESRDIVAPFPKWSDSEGYNTVYAYFLEICRENNLKAAFTTSADIVGAGMCLSYWLFKDNAWTKVQKLGFSKHIFDKFAPKTKSLKTKRDLLFSSRQIRPFNNPYLFNLCFDKQKTYEKFSNFSIPTVAIEDRTRQGVAKALKLLEEKVTTHKYRSDFSGEVVVKDRFGAGGLNIYKFGNDQVGMMTSLVKKCKTVSFVIQPFVKFDKSLGLQNSYRPTDIRLIYLGQEIKQTYIRIAQKGDFRCNEHAGGVLKYISQSEVPSKVISVSNNIARILNNKSSVYALDFIISNNGNIYLLEANAAPGLDWDLSNKENEKESKKLMRIIIGEISRRINSSKTLLKEKW